MFCRVNSSIIAESLPNLNLSPASFCFLSMVIPAAIVILLTYILCVGYKMNSSILSHCELTLLVASSFSSMSLLTISIYAFTIVVIYWNLNILSLFSSLDFNTRADELYKTSFTAIIIIGSNLGLFSTASCNICTTKNAQRYQRVSGETREIHTLIYLWWRRYYRYGSR